MKIHSDILTRENFRAAEKRAGVTIVELEQVGSRARDRAFRFYLSGSSAYKGGWARNSDTPAATWDEWGIFFAELFNADPVAHCTKNSYLSAEHFHWVTGNRFRTLTLLLQHKRHKWEPQGAVATGSYYVATCDCGAVNRWVARGYTFDDLSAGIFGPDHPSFGMVV